MGRTNRSYGEGSIYESPAGSGTWHADVPLANGKRKRQRFSKRTSRENQRDAERARKEIVKARDTGLDVADDPTVEQFAKIWYEKTTKKLAPSTRYFYRNACDYYILPFIGQRKLKSFTPENAADFVASLEEFEEVHEDGHIRSFSSSTVFHGFNVARRIFNVAVQWRKIQYNPFTLIDTPDSNPAIRLPFTQDEVRRILAAVENHRLAALYHLDFTWGLRRGELIGLRWSDVNWDKATLSIEQQYQYIPGKGIFAKAPKTKRGIRTIPLTSDLLDRLHDHQTQQIQERTEGWKEHNLIFPSNVGTPLNGRNLVTHWHNLLESVGMPKSPFHRIRHTAATQMEERGLSRAIMQAILGQSDLKTSDRYTHAREEALREAAKRMGDQE